MILASHMLENKARNPVFVSCLKVGGDFSLTRVMEER